MAYVVRDRRALAQWAAGLVASVVVVVLVCVAADRWWVAAVGLPLSLGWAVKRVRRETTPLRADATGIALDGRWTEWGDVEEVAVLDRRVRVTPRARAPLPEWARGRVTGDSPGDGPGDGPGDSPQDGRLHLTTRVEGDPRAVYDGIRREAPASVDVIVRW